MDDFGEILTVDMAANEKVTVEKAYFDALLRRADFHTSTQLLGRPDPVNVTISKVEYDSLLRTVREYDCLKNALLQGGISTETLELLISEAPRTDERRKNSSESGAWAEDITDHLPPYEYRNPHTRLAGSQTGSHVKNIGLTPDTGPYRNGNAENSHTTGRAQFSLRVPGYDRQVSFGAAPSSVPDEGGFDDADSVLEDIAPANSAGPAPPPSQERRTLYFNGFSDRTSYRDLLSVIKGGKLLSVNLRPERSGTVTFLDGNAASEFLAWAKKHDIYLHSKRIEVKWADRQYRLNGHIYNKILGGATRNIIVHNAINNGLTEASIRADMEHIHNLDIIDVQFRNGDAYVSTNSVHNALFARTCMMSRTAYKGCKVEFFRDECDCPLPVSMSKPKAPPPEPIKKCGSVTNRFNLLSVAESEASSEENNQLLDSTTENDEIFGMESHVGVRLDFLDPGSG